jgi:polar amino acid transport system substrate-binding protein
MMGFKTLRVAFVVLVVICLALVSFGLSEEEVLRFGIDADYPPWTWFEEGEFRGFDVEVIKAIADRAGLKYEFVALPWEIAVPAMAAGEIDLLSGGMWITCEREKVMDFTDPYWTEHAEILVRVDSGLNIATALCCGAKIGALGGSTNYDWIKALADDPKTDVTAIAYETVLLGIEDLIIGRIDSFHLDTMTAYEFMEKYPEIESVGRVYMWGETAYAIEEGDPHGLFQVFREGFEWLWETGKWEELFAKYFPWVEPYKVPMKRVLECPQAEPEPYW